MHAIDIPINPKYIEVFQNFPETVYVTHRKNMVLLTEIKDCQIKIDCTSTVIIRVNFCIIK